MFSLLSCDTKNSNTSFIFDNQIQQNCKKWKKNKRVTETYLKPCQLLSAVWEKTAFSCKLFLPKIPSQICDALRNLVLFV